MSDKTYFENAYFIIGTAYAGKSGFILEIIDGRELPEYMTMNKGKICG